MGIGGERAPAPAKGAPQAPVPGRANFSASLRVCPERAHTLGGLPWHPGVDSGPHTKVQGLESQPSPTLPQGFPRKDSLRPHCRLTRQGFS